MRRQTNNVRKIFNRPVSLEAAIKISMFLIAIGAGFTAVSALGNNAGPKRNLAANTPLKPIILGVDWQETPANGHSVALAYAR